MTNFATRLKLVAQQPDIVNAFNRGVERETLRYTKDGQLVQTPHPEALGAALTNQFITTDFAEQLLEFITPVSQDISTLVQQLSDIHRFAQVTIDDEGLWPMSMPCYVGDEENIQLAKYGTSNIGKMKTLYRQGLKNRYGSLMQIISGVHFNFSFPESFWDAIYGKQSDSERCASKSEAYLGVIRNYYRFGWLLPYLFGASPALCSSFIKGRETSLPFENIGETLYLPYATSLRLSDLGYTNSAQSTLKIGFNSLEQYLEGLRQAIHSPSEEFAQIGVKVNGEYNQLNSNVLQIENELYAPIRPKRVTQSGEKPSEALENRGIEYIEVRSLDVNPFSPIGITEPQIRFLDLFLTWTALSDSEPMDDCELNCWRENWQKVILEGRKPGLELQIGCHGEVLTLQAWAKRVFGELKLVAEWMDQATGDHAYQDVCEQLSTCIDLPESTLSGQFLEQIRQSGGLGKTGRALGDVYRQYHLAHNYQYYSQKLMEEEVTRSMVEQDQIEQDDRCDFDAFLQQYFSYLNTQEEQPLQVACK
ncbi:glutamate--cysteine ligase [Vibrio gazogenes]|uniref:Glutamate--cysteine ligase n=1 Tax=Vibrio gazogenes DSM 21264 = NBRC 103151 TaxID=1123492 RepID=A0A1M4WNI9_VIBGA|nr:glutamate--cysteine ligase [Vibrio gazogenes]USP13183.1 glutamate--cysteine ligase [Vibrio gazogenes]SHE82532.1 glutamate-cysteine ligase [Vibrio gazogenes DSM 21264] [Vibrio gazogenes DSM 21264 = NBRC 103151]SJN59152.1 Glutamate--cysteine ligase [Vibrio gazogenes]